MREGVPTIEPLGDSALLVRWPGGIGLPINAQVHRFAKLLENQNPPWLLDCVPAYSSLAVILDMQRCGDSFSDAEHWLMQRLAAEPADLNEPLEGALPPRQIEIPVCYDAAFGPDLSVIAHATGLAISEIIDRHCEPTYQVAMLGFSPGFPYLLGLDAALAMPRMSTPRSNVPAGSVAIGGSQTGIYPRFSPGGWRLIGRTPLELFDPTRPAPSLLLPGDEVSFVAISRRQFEAQGS